MKLALYRWLAKLYLYNRQNIIFELAARIVIRFFGLVDVNYQGVKLALGPLALLDRYMLCGIDINPDLSHAINQYLKAGDVFLDVGANHGVFSLLAAKNKDVQVYAFEPSSRELKRFQKNMALNSFSNIKIFNVGLSDRVTQQNLSLSDLDNPGMNTLPQVSSIGTFEKCKFSPPDHFINTKDFKKVKLIKLDVEGQELIVLQGFKTSMHLLKQAVFVIEMSPHFLKRLNASIVDIYSFFETYGFKFVYGISDLVQWEEVFYHPDFNLPFRGE